jgi:hypothetical protein
MSVRTLLAVLCLLALAASASGECAWVLWDIQTPFQPKTRPTICTVDSAHETRKACDSVAQDKATRPWNNPQDSFVRFVCLPDTVDPVGRRGNKSCSW